MSIFKGLIITLILIPNFVFGATNGSFTDGFETCYQYGVDEPPFTITYGGSTATQLQVQVEFSSGYTNNAGVARYVYSSGLASPYSNTLVWSTAFDGVNARPWVSSRVNYYSDTEGFEGWENAVFTVQDDPCAVPEENTDIATSTIEQVQENIFNLFFIFTFGFGYGLYLTRKNQ